VNKKEPFRLYLEFHWRDVPENL